MLRAILLQYKRATRRKPRQPLYRKPGAFAHHVVECASHQQNEQQGDRRVEIGVRAMHHRFVETHAEGQQHAKGDRHIHIGASVPHGLPG